MKRIQLRFDSIQQIVGGEGISVIVLTDMERKNALSVVCDGHMSHQLLIRVNNIKECDNMLPETLVGLLKDKFELMIYGLYDGQYQVVLMDEFGNSKRMRISDAILLTMISDTPLYIEGTLLERQSVPYDADAKGIAIPINTMDVPRLKQALQRAVDDENYELASQLRDEINRRSEK